MPQGHGTTGYRPKQCPSSVVTVNSLGSIMSARCTCQSCEISFAIARISSRKYENQAGRVLSDAPVDPDLALLALSFCSMKNFPQGVEGNSISCRETNSRWREIQSHTLTVGVQMEPPNRHITFPRKSDPDPNVPCFWGSCWTHNW